MVKEKRDGRLKGRAVADGRKQMAYIKKEDVASSTVKLESLVLSLLIDIQENMDVATADVVGAYLIADMDDHVIVKLMWESVDIMCKENPKYRKYVGRENGKKGIICETIAGSIRMHAIRTTMVPAVQAMSGEGRL